MTNLRMYLESALGSVISSWNEKDIYAISFLVCANEAYEYGGCSNVTEFSVSYNTVKDYGGAPPLSEERWNYAFWRQNETYIIEADPASEGMRILFDWYRENGIDNIGYEDHVACYDTEMRYIGKGPVGCYELVQEVAIVAKSLHSSGFIRRMFGRPIPIIIHDLEYSWYTIEATKTANAGGEAAEFLTAMKALGIAE